MFNYLWSYMIFIGLFIASLNGKISIITNTLIESSKSGISLCITMLGIVGIWSGILKIAEKSGLTELLASKMMPILIKLFPDIPKNHTAFKYISTNFIANFLGLGWASTPAGLKAMQELQKINPKKDTASKSMCMFLIINMSSLQLVTMSTIAFRAEYGSKNASEIIGPGILATLITTISAIFIGKIIERMNNN